MRRPLSLAIVLCVLACCTASALADDWPQWMGPQRDNVWRESGILEKFPEGGPRILWRTPVAWGYSGPAVANGRVFVTDFATDADLNVDNFARAEFPGEERIHCLDEKTGEILWTHKSPTTYTMSYPAGPRTTPIVADGTVYALGGEGQLTCLDATTGDVVWEKNFRTDYNAPSPLWGFACHPLLDGDRLICIVGGEGTHAVAFNKDTGEEIWRALTSPEQGYSPPTIIEVAGQRQLILAAPSAIAALNPETGALLWPEPVPYKADNGGLVMSPVWSGHLLYVGGYNNQSVALKPAADGKTPDIAWHSKGKDAIAPINVQPHVVDGVMYGFDQTGMLRAIDLAAGKALWETGQPLGRRPLPSGTAFLVRHGDRFWMFTEAGELVIAKLTPKSFEELDRAKVIEPTGAAHGRNVVWSMPAFANRRAYIRNGKEIICVDLSAATQ
jgi:outer membrane protein assembly factor BamB